MVIVSSPTGTTGLGASNATTPVFKSWLEAIKAEVLPVLIMIRWQPKHGNNSTKYNQT
jgi:hypothetical protein